MNLPYAFRRPTAFRPVFWALLLLPAAAFCQKPAQTPPKAAPKKPAAAAAEPAKPAAKANAAQEPVCLVLEPQAMKTKAARPLPGARATVLSPAAETKEGLKVMDAEAFAKTGLDWAAFEQKAREAASKHLKTLKPEISRDAHGAATHALLHSDREFHSSILLCPEFGKLFEKEFGPDLVVLAPDRFSVYVFSRTTGNFQQYADRLWELHHDSTYPASAEAFSWSPEGLKAIGTLEPGK